MLASAMVFRFILGGVMSCEGCKFWSALVAQSIGCGPIEALCLNKESDKFNKMTKEADSCESREPGQPIDLPF